MSAVRGEDGRQVKIGNWGARMQNFYWNVQKKIAESK
jgi:hypothetical protein